LKEYLREGGTITVIEGDHGSVYFHPASEAAHKAIQSQVELQRLAGGNAMIGRELYPLRARQALTRFVCLREWFMLIPANRNWSKGSQKDIYGDDEGVRDAAISAGIIEQNVFDQGIKDLYRTTEADGVFCYTFFKAVGNK